MTDSASPVTRRAVFAQAWPIILGQALVPTVGLVDVTIIGRTGDTLALAGVALGATVVTLVFWTFGFLRMGMTGLTAQAQGAGDSEEVTALLLRGLAAGAGIGLLVLALHPLILPIILDIMAAPEPISAQAHVFASARMFGAPAALGVFAINGWLIGLGRTRAALGIQIVTNGANILFDTLLVWGMGMGALGVGIGTAAAEWVALAMGMLVALRVVGPGWMMRVRKGGLFAGAAMRRLFAVNADIMIRTVALLALFTWFTHAGARLGTVPLAANHVLMQFVSLSAFVLDGFAFTAESRVGMAVGARSMAGFRRAVRLTAEFSLATGAAFALAFLLGGSALIAFITPDPATRAAANAMLPFAAAIPFIGAPSWLLDGIFIGATQSRAMRNATVVVTLFYLATDWLMRPLGHVGMWIALLASYAYRAGSLGIFVPGLLRHTGLIAQSKRTILRSWKS